MEVISVRVPAEDLRVLREHGVQPATLCRERLHEEAVRVRLASARRFLGSVAVRPTRSAVDQLREERRGH